MARIKQTARRSTGGTAPRKALTAGGFAGWYVEEPKRQEQDSTAAEPNLNLQKSNKPPDLLRQPKDAGVSKSHPSTRSKATATAENATKHLKSIALAAAKVAGRLEGTSDALLELENLTARLGASVNGKTQEVLGLRRTKAGLGSIREKVTEMKDEIEGVQGRVEMLLGQGGDETDDGVYDEGKEVKGEEMFV